MLVEVQKQVVWATWLRQFDLVQLNCYLGAKVDTKVTKARTDDLDQLNWYLRARRAVHLQLLAIAGGALQRQKWKLTTTWTWKIMWSSSSEEIFKKSKRSFCRPKRKSQKLKVFPEEEFSWSTTKLFMPAAYRFLNCKAHKVLPFRIR